VAASAGKSLIARRLWLLRGESAIASIGIAVVAILLGAMGAASWWTFCTQKDAFVNARLSQVTALGDVLSQSSESMLANGELSTLRRIIIEARRNYDLTECQVMLPDGKVLASAEPSKITQISLPERWAAAPMDERGNAVSDDQVTMSFPFHVAGRGGAVLILGAAIKYPTELFRSAQVGVGMIGAAALLALLMVYRKSRGQLVMLGSIREALLATHAGETSPDAMTLSESAGPEAAAWNALVNETVALKQKSIAERAQASLGTKRETSGLLDRLCDALPQGLVMLDEQGRVSYANGAAAVMLQAKREELLGSDVIKVISDQALKEAILAAVTGTARVRKTLELAQTGQGGEGVLRFAIRPTRRGNAQEVMITIDDITQQRVADESRNSFVAQATHELRTPLTNIRLYVETALDEGENDAAVRTKALNVINQETRRLELVIGEMLSVSEIEAGSLKICKSDVRLDHLFEEIEADYRAQATDKEITLAFNLPPKLPVIQADRDKFAIALHNLLGNALKYTPKGGKVTFTVKNDNHELAVEVTDTGIGIEEQELERVFERFYRSKDPRVNKITGTGLGLTLAREVMRQHGGDITVQSQMNLGSTFTLTLPLPRES
jgi:PAS domain S-box-containing protein